MTLIAHLENEHGMLGGRANNTWTMGVLQGYGSDEGLLTAGADCVADSVDTLIALLDATPSRARREDARHTNSASR